MSGIVYEESGVTVRFVSVNIVNQLFDHAEVSVEKRQAINDECDEFVQRLINGELSSRLKRVQELEAENAKTMDGLVEHQKHRDAWRRYTYGRGPRPMDFLDGNMVESDRGPTRIEELEAELERVKSIEFPKRVDAVSNAWREKVAALEAAVVALREGLERIINVQEINHQGITVSEYEQAISIAEALLASPNPGERVKAVLDVAVEYYDVPGQAARRRPRLEKVSPMPSNIDDMVRELREAHRAATPGPWQTRFLYRSFHVVRENASALGLFLDPIDNDWNDADFIVKAITHMPAILEALDRVTGERDAARAAITGVDFHNDCCVCVLCELKTEYLAPKTPESKDA